MGGSTRGLVPARVRSYSLAKSARATYAAATTPAATASGGRRSGAEEAGRSAFGGVAQRFAGLVGLLIDRPNFAAQVCEAAARPALKQMAIRLTSCDARGRA